MFDLEKDPSEMKNIYENPEYATVRRIMTEEYNRMRDLYDAPDY